MVHTFESLYALSDFFLASHEKIFLSVCGVLKPLRTPLASSLLA